MRSTPIATIYILMLMTGLGWAAENPASQASDAPKNAARSTNTFDPLVGYWRFDGDLRDASGQGHDAQGEAGYTEGKSGQALQVKERRVQIASGPDLALLPGFAIDCWVYFNVKPDDSKHNEIVQKEGEYLLRVDKKDEGGQVSLFTYLDGYWEPRIRSKIIPQAGRWYHVRAVWSGTRIRLDIDDQNWSCPRLGWASPTENPILVGPVGGRIDELKISNPSMALIRAASAKAAAFPDKRSGQTSFGKADGWPGWQASGGAALSVKADSLEARFPNAGACVFAPGLDVELAKKRYIGFDLICATAETANLLFVTDKGAAVVAIPILDANGVTVADLGSHPQWKGRLKLLGLFFDDQPHTAILHNLWISDVRSSAREVVPRSVEVGDLVCDWFAHLATYWRQKRMVLSGWDVLRGGEVSDRPPARAFSYGYYDWFKLTADDGQIPVTIRRRFVAQRDGTLTWEFKFRLPKLADGPAFALQSGTTPVLNLSVQGGQLLAQGAGAAVTVAALRAGEDCGVLAQVDSVSRQVRLRINGRTAAQPVKLADGQALDHVAITTGPGYLGDLFVNPVLLYRGFAVRERFITVPVGTVPDDWTMETGGGTVSVQRPGGTAHGADRNALKLEKNRAGKVEAVIRFAPLAGPVDVEAKVWVPQPIDGVQVLVTDAEGRVIAAIATRDGNWVFPDADGQTQVLWKGYRPTVWYDLRLVLDPQTRTAAAFVNNIPVATGLKIPEVRGGIAGLRLATSEADKAVFWADNLVVCPHLQYPKDYVPEPQPVATGPVLVGMQSCDLWRAGLHNGWDFIRPYPERRPLMGYYNGGDPEVEDWAIKWMCENGIAFDFKCWYRAEPGRPIHSVRCGEGLEGFQRSRWGAKMHFAVNLTNHSDMFAGLDDWKENVVPYLIEHLFRDPRYMVIDRKPLIGIYDPHWLNRDVGQAKVALEFLRQECRKAGFDGCWVVAQLSEPNANKLADFAKWGFDAVYAYSWGAADAKGQEQQIQAQRTSGKMDTLATLVMGRDDRAWDGPRGYWLTAKEFRGLLEWTRDQYLPSPPGVPDTTPRASPGAVPAVLSRRLVMLGNWNEFGEGHFMMPSGLMGFGYVNAVRDVFGKPPFPANVVPTPAQQARLDTLYPKGDW